MARIRTVKPEFFRHELLQALEAANPGKYPMFVFQGLWTLCDKAGRFEWRPKQLKLDILPFLDFAMEDTLLILVAAGMIRVYEVDGDRYGLIETLPDHQRFSGSEAKQLPIHPAPTTESFVDLRSVRSDTQEALRKHLGSDEEASRKRSGTQERKGKEEEGKGKERSLSASGDAAPKNWVALLCADYLDATEGHIPPGELGRALKPLITTHGLEETRSRWSVFIHHADVKYGAVYFAKHFGNYKPGSNLIGVGGNEAEVVAFLELDR